MKASTKQSVARIIAKHILPLTLKQQDPFDMLCRDVCKFHLKRISQESLLKSLQKYYSEIQDDTTRLKQLFDITNVKKHLADNHGYKYMINDPKKVGLINKLRISNRRLAIMQQLGMKVDVVILRDGDYIPPHGHKRMVSGFFVLEGKVGVRHYNCIDQSNESMLIKKTVDSVYEKNNYTSNSDQLDNIHWLKGVEDNSFLYRVSIIDKDKENGKSNMGAEERIYINPTIPPDDNGYIKAPYINEEIAKNLTFSNA